MGGADMLLVMTTMPDVQAARALAAALVEGRLAACVSIQSGCESFYRWNGAVEQAHEVPVLIKTTAGRYAALEAELCRLHPYALPEIVAIPVTHVLPRYLQWVVSETIEADGNRTIESIPQTGHR
jgi:periplasmic divalent cation tolerance protein